MSEQKLREALEALGEAAGHLGDELTHLPEAARFNLHVKAYNMEKAANAFLAAASAPWSPPPEDQRPEGFRCLCGFGNDEWQTGVWKKYYNGGGCWSDTDGRLFNSPVAFAPLPAPVEGGQS